MGGAIRGGTHSLEELFRAGFYKIDVYQREYAWSAEDVRNLVDDLTLAFDRARRDSRYRRGMHGAEPYFLGPFVYFTERKGIRFLVDGQQRFTTLHLIFMHLHRQALALGDKDAEQRLDRVIRDSERGAWTYRIDIEERRAALDALFHGRQFTPRVPGSSISLRNLCRRSAELGALLEQRIDADALRNFVEWLLGCVLVGIEAPSKDDGYRIFESMNDRGARLAPIDLLKSYLLSNVNRDEQELNREWREMLGELTPATATDQSAPSRFVKAALVARHARLDGYTPDVEAIDTALHVWVRSNGAELLALREAPDFFDFVESMVRLAKHYRTFFAATERLDRDHGLETLYYNHRNGLTNQMTFILAAVHPNDTPAVANEKAGLIARFIDRWFVTNLLADNPVLARDLDTLMPTLVPRLRRCRTAADVADMLGAEIREDDFYSVASFGLRGNNLAHVRYLLARITAYVERGWNPPDRIEQYLDDARSWQIEHIFPTHHARHPEVADPVTFRLLRNRLGVLVLLPASFNMSLQDMPIEKKFDRYRSQNALAGCLHPLGTANNKPLRTFIKQHNLDRHLRPFNKGNSIVDAVELRQELYRRICCAIWGRDALGFPREAPESPDEVSTATTTATVGGQASPSVPRQRRSGPPTHVEQMVRAGVLPSGSRVVGSTGAADFWATVDEEGSFVLPSGDRFRKADDAGYAVIDKRCKGMQFWHIETPDGARVSLADLRRTMAST